MAKVFNPNTGQIEEEVPLMLQNPDVVENAAPEVEVARAPAQTAGPVTAAGLLSKYAEPREANYTAKQIDIPKVDYSKTQEEMATKLDALKSEYDKSLQEAQDRDFRSAIWAALGNSLPGAIAGATAMRTKAAVKAPEVTKITPSDTASEATRKYKTDYEGILDQYKTLKSGQITDKDILQAKTAQAYLDLGAERLNANISNTDRSAGIRVNSAIVKDQEKQELSDKQVTELSDIDKAMQVADAIGKRAAGFEKYLGPISAREQALQRGAAGTILPGKADPKFTEFLADVERARAEYQKVISGLTVSDKERESLRQSIPTGEDRLPDFMAKQRSFIRNLDLAKKKSEANLKKYQGKNVEGYSQPVKQSPSSGPYGETTQRDGKTYKWNAAVGKYQLVK